MFDIDGIENFSSNSDDVATYDSFQFDPEQTSGDDELDGDSLAMRDAMRDIVHDEGRFELLMF